MVWRRTSATFLIFSDYMRPPIRLVALMGLHVIYVFTHDSLALGQDGPTHQPVEQLAGLRAVPDLTVIRPGDANETAVAWRVALEAGNHPVALVLTRQRLAKSCRMRVVSMPSWELFDAQPRNYRDQVLLPSIHARLAVEAGASQGWHRYVGDRGDVLGVDRFGASAPGDVVMHEYGFTVENVCKRTLALLR
jgi:transketolase